MNNFWPRTVLNTVYFKKNKEKILSSYKLAKGYKDLQKMVFQGIKDTIPNSAGILSAGFELKSFFTAQ